MTPTLPAALRTRFQAVRLLGRGTYGAVVLARDRELRRDVAIKLLVPEGLRKATYRHRLEREARLSAGLTSPFVARLYDFDMTGDEPWMLSEYVDGEDLDRVLTRQEDGRLPLGEAAHILEQMLRGLEEAHAAGVLHRDLKLANVMIGKDGRTRIIDWGLGRAEMDSTLTATGALVGTPLSMAPEQMRGEDVTEAADLYAAALVFLVLVTGSNPYRAPSLPEVHHKKTRELEAPLAAAGVDAPAALDACLQTWLAPEPEDRPESAAVMRRQLRDALASDASLSGSLLPEGRLEREPEPVPRGALAPRVGGGPRAASLVAAGLLAAGALLVFGRYATAPPVLARQPPPPPSMDHEAVRQELARFHQRARDLPEVRALFSLTDDASNDAALAAWRRAREAYRDLARDADLDGLGARAAALPLDREVASWASRILLVERLLDRTVQPETSPLRAGPSPLEPVLERLLRVRDAPEISGFPDDPWPVRRLRHLRTLQREGERWESVRPLGALVIRGREELGPITDVHVHSPAGIPFEFPLPETGAAFADAFYESHEQERSRLAVPDVRLPLTHRGGDLELALVLAGWGPARHLVLELEGPSPPSEAVRPEEVPPPPTLVLVLTPSEERADRSFRVDEIYHEGYRLRIAGEALPRPLEAVRMHIVGIQPLGSPKSALDIVEVYQRVDPL